MYVIFFFEIVWRVLFVVVLRWCCFFFERMLDVVDDIFFVIFCLWDVISRLVFGRLFMFLLRIVDVKVLELRSFFLDRVLVILMRVFFGVGFRVIGIVIYFWVLIN